MVQRTLPNWTICSRPRDGAQQRSQTPVASTDFCELGILSAMRPANELVFQAPKDELAFSKLASQFHHRGSESTIYEVSVFEVPSLPGATPEYINDGSAKMPQSWNAQAQLQRQQKQIAERKQNQKQVQLRDEKINAADESWRGCKFRRKVETAIIAADPWKIFFSNPRINNCFSCGRSLTDTIEALQKGDITVEDIPKITVVERGGRLITLDHRRLFCFRAALPKGAEIPVQLLQTPWLAHRSLAPNPQVYNSVRVESDHLGH